ncbi:M56 family metallopeptidase [Enterocloster bolteae]|uniref:Regulatory protein BlaR1 n=1 Tax=Enterocloster bolteae TaxID=208479 RepID=A0A6N2XU91_9FIRM
MIDFITLMISLSLSASILLGIVECLNKIGYPIYGIFWLEKLVCIFYLLPSFFVVAFVYYHLTASTIAVLKTEDFFYISHNGYLNELIFLKQNGMVQIITKRAVVIWSIGFILFFGVDLVRSERLLKKLFMNYRIVTEGVLYNLMNDIRKELKIKKRITLYQSSEMDMPFATGFYNLKIVLPIADNTEDEWRMLIKHELIHCKRNDVLMKLLVRFVQKIHWYNPVIFLFSRSFNEVCEYTCDLEVVKNYNKEQQMQYGELIIKMAQKRPMPKFTIGFSENNFGFIKRRLEHIMKKRLKNGMAILATMVVIVAACPVITYGATMGVIRVESSAAQFYDEQRSTMIPQDVQSNMRVMIENNTVNDGDYIGRLDTRGTNNIDVTIKSEGVSRFSPVSLNQGSSVRIVVYSDNESDSFRAGIIAPDGKKYYSSSVRGTVSNTFSIDTAGSYTVYLEGRNGSGGSSIHITGTIYVNY